MTTGKVYKAWGACLRCDFEGSLDYVCLAGERYDEPDAQMVMLEQTCPACGSVENSLLPYDYFQEIKQHSEQEDPESSE